MQSETERSIILTRFVELFSELPPAARQELVELITQLPAQTEGRLLETTEEYDPDNHTDIELMTLLSALVNFSESDIDRLASEQGADFKAYALNLPEEWFHLAQTLRFSTDLLDLVLKNREREFKPFNTSFPALHTITLRDFVEEYILTQLCQTKDGRAVVPLTLIRAALYFSERFKNKNRDSITAIVVEARRMLRISQKNQKMFSFSQIRNPDGFELDHTDFFVLLHDARQLLNYLDKKLTLFKPGRE